MRFQKWGGDGSKKLYSTSILRARKQFVIKKACPKLRKFQNCMIFGGKSEINFHEIKLWKTYDL